MLELGKVRNIEALSRYVRMQRAAARLTQADVAEAVGVSSVTVSNLERGSDAVRVGTVLAILRHLEQVNQEDA